EDLVAFLDDGIAVRDDAAPAAVDRDDAALDLRDVLRQLAPPPADEGPAAMSLRRDEPHAAVGELEHLQRPGEMDQLLDVFRHERLGADANVDREAIRAEELRVADIFVRANPCDL